MISGVSYCCLLMEANCYISSSPGNIFLERGGNRIGSRYKKAVYREYTDDTFTVQEERRGSQLHLGIMGTLSAPYDVSFFYQKRI